MGRKKTNDDFKNLPTQSFQDSYLAFLPKLRKIDFVIKSGSKATDSRRNSSARVCLHPNIRNLPKSPCVMSSRGGIRGSSNSLCDVVVRRRSHGFLWRQRKRWRHAPFLLGLSCYVSSSSQTSRQCERVGATSTEKSKACVSQF